VRIFRADGVKRYALASVMGGSVGNLFDRIYYSAVPDFLDLHINNLHWFIFNVADIFITLGIISLILEELFNTNKNEKII
jgi:signal peptidase II